MPAHDNTPSSPFGRGWIPAGREIGLPGEAGLGGAGEGAFLAPLPQACPEPVEAAGGAGGRQSARAGSAAPGGEGEAHPNPSRLREGLSSSASSCSPASLREPLCASAPLREPSNLPALRHDGFSPERQARFLQALSIGGSVRSAAASVGVSAQAVYLARRRSGHFAAAWDAALVLARDHAEQVLAERALEGVEEAVFYHGEEVARRRRYDSRLLLAHLARLDRKAEGDPAARRRAGRFDELLATLTGAAPEGIEPQPWKRSHDPFLPTERADHVAAITEGLGPRAYPRARRRAEATWDKWQARAEQVVDRLSATAHPELVEGPMEFKSLHHSQEIPARTLSTSSTSSDENTALTPEDVTGGRGNGPRETLQPLNPETKKAPRFPGAPLSSDLSRRIRPSSTYRTRRPTAWFPSAALRATSVRCRLRSGPW